MRQMVDGGGLSSAKRAMSAMMWWSALRGRRQRVSLHAVQQDQIGCISVAAAQTYTSLRPQRPQSRTSTPLASRPERRPAAYELCSATSW